MATSRRAQGGANSHKRQYLEETVAILNAARAFYLEFLLAHPDKLRERVEVESSQTGEGKPGIPTAANHPILYAGTFTLELDALDLRKSFVRLKVYTGLEWVWAHYPTMYNRYFERRRAEAGWEQESPRLILGKQVAAIHFLQSKTIKARKIVESKRDPDLVTVAVDLNVKQLAVITARAHGTIIQTRFVSDQGLDQHRYRHLRRVAKKQWQSGQAVKGERSNQQLWRHIRRQNTDAAHKTARAIVEVCERYPGCVLLFERLRTIKPKGGSKSRRRNRKQANQLKGKINQLAKEKAYAQGVVSVEVNPHGTSQYCSRCGAKGMRFSLVAGQRLTPPSPCGNDNYALAGVTFQTSNACTTGT